MVTLRLLLVRSWDPASAARATGETEDGGEAVLMVGRSNFSLLAWMNVVDWCGRIDDDSTKAK